MNRLYRLAVLLLIVGILTGCDPNKTKPIQENYEFSQKTIYYLQPNVVDGAERKTALIADTDDGNFYVFSKDESVAEEFVNAQRTLIAYLQSRGVHIDEMKYYGTDIAYSFSESSKSAAHVSLSDLRSWQQVLVTLQTIWGDYTDYGYLFALSNAIAEELEWETEDIPAYQEEEMNSFFVDNPAAIHLLYPTFTTKFASEETVNNSKALAGHLFEQINWKDALHKSISDQLKDYYGWINAFAKHLSIPYTPQTCGYAYYGEDIKLRIKTTYLEIVIDGNFHDVRESIYGDCWNDYESIYKTVSLMDQETCTAVEAFELQSKVQRMQLKLIDSNNEWEDMYLPDNLGGRYVASTTYANSLFSYLHGFYRHLMYALKEDAPYTWKVDAFCEIGAAHSLYRQEGIEAIFSELEEEDDFFYAYTGRKFRPGTEDIFEAFDILCFIHDQFEYPSRESINSFNHYLIGIYGEKAVYHIMLYPDTIEEATGKTWEQLSAEWEQYIRSKYTNAILV